MNPGQQNRLADLRLQIARFEGGSQKTKPLPFGLRAVDEHLPGGGLARGALHEMIEAGLASEFAGSTTLFTAGGPAPPHGPRVLGFGPRGPFPARLLLRGPPS